MTVFVNNEVRGKMTEPYLSKTQFNDMTEIPLNTNKTEEKSSNNTKIFWIKITGIYFVLFSLTICLIGTLGFGHRILNKISDTCSCSIDSKNIILRIEELERKIKSYETYAPIISEFESQVNTSILVLNIH